MTLKVRIVLFLTFDSKTTEGPKIFLWPFSWFFGLTCWPLNLGACRKKIIEHTNRHGAVCMTPAVVACQTG